MMMLRVALRNVLRHRLRTAFSVAALAIAVALLADMLMLSTGMEKTFNRVLASVGYEVRVCPRGTLPFATEAVITESSRVTDRLARDERVARVLRDVVRRLHSRLRDGRERRRPVAVPGGGGR
jgi:putative ABC transport system permease protein